MHAFDSVPRLQKFRAALPGLLGDKAPAHIPTRTSAHLAYARQAAGLSAEGNHYFEEKSGIGFHGQEHAHTRAHVGARTLARK